MKFKMYRNKLNFYVGARIEIHNTVDNRPVLRVAPLVGARIEIVFVPVKIAIVTRRSPRGSED